MCRYAMYRPYKKHYACFDCRLMVRWPQDAHRPPRDYPTGAVCPECKCPMHNMGLDFKAPPKRNTRQWEKVRVLHQKGVRWASCGCGPGHNFRTLREAREYQPGPPHDALGMPVSRP